MKRFQQFAAGTALSLVLAGCFGVGEAFGKDTSPTSLNCDKYDKSTSPWQRCIAVQSVSDEELFYAGYWLAKSGHFSKALKYLNATKVKTTRIETYIGFATRKLGNLEGALSHYASALDKDPNNTVARSYLGEAYLALKKPKLAERQLRTIERLCGVQCQEYTELKHAITEFVRRKG